MIRTALRYAVEAIGRRLASGAVSHLANDANARAQLANLLAAATPATAGSISGCSYGDALSKIDYMAEALEQQTKLLAETRNGSEPALPGSNAAPLVVASDPAVIGRIQATHDVLRLILNELHLQRLLLAGHADDALVRSERERVGAGLIQGAATSVSSQSYEDAAIAEIFARIGPGERTFIEIGAGNGLENTTRLLVGLGWQGIWVEGDPANLDHIRQTHAIPLSDGRLKLHAGLVTRESINRDLEQAGAREAVDLVSVDIDQNTSHVWRAMRTRSRVACIEYNSHFPPSIEFEVAYAPDGAWRGTNIFGASLKTLELIGREKGMALVGCDLAGINAYFVDEREVGDRFAGPFTAEHHYQPPRFALVRGSRGHPSGPI